MPNPGFANSGVQYRSFEVPQNQWVMGGYQADMDGDDQWTGGIYGERFRGVLCPPGKKAVVGNDHQPKVIGQVASPQELKKTIKHREWNEYVVVAQDFHFIQKINGMVTADLMDDDKAVRRTDGLIGLQLHAGPPMKVEFRNIRLKEIPAKTSQDNSGKKKVVFIAGGPSHGYAQHAHFAGCTLLANILNENVPAIHAVVCRNGWPKDTSVLDDAAAIVIYSDGGEGQPMIPHFAELQPLMKKGVGLALLHYAVEVPKGDAGQKTLDWVGGYFETNWSVNPFWTAKFQTFPDHPVARGLKPFTIEDEWYYHMRFPEEMKGVTPILTAVPPDSTRERGNDPHGGNPEVRKRKGMPEHLAWVYQRPEGGRGFGFTGGHVHWNWANDAFRTTILNAIVWIAGVEVPEGGVPSKAPTVDELLRNQDFDPPQDFKPAQVEELIEKWK